MRTSSFYLLQMSHPELEHQQPPEPVRVIPSSFVVFFQKLHQKLFRDDIAIEKGSAGQDVP